MRNLIILIILNIVALVSGPHYLFSSDREPTLLPISRNGLDGYINKQGQIIIDPVFSYAQSFSEGHAIVKKNHKYYILNKNDLERRRIDLKTNLSIFSIGNFSGGYAVVKFKGGGVSFIDYCGKMISELIYEDAKSFSDELAAIKIDNKWGYINNKNDLIIENKFDTVRPFSEGIASVKIDNKWGLINKEGKFIVRPKYNYIMGHSEGLAYVFDGQKMIFVNMHGEKKIDASAFEGSNLFSEGLAPVIIKGKSGFINKKGKIVIPPYFEAVKSFSGGLAAVKINNEWGFIDNKGRVLIKPKWSDVGPFQNGIARVWFGSNYGYIDKNGNYIWKPKR